MTDLTAPTAGSRRPHPTGASPGAAATEPTPFHDDGPVWWRWTRRAFAGVLVLAMVVAWALGLTPFLLVYGPIVVLVATVIQRVSAKIRGRLVTGISRHLFARENRPYLVQIHIRGPLSVLATYAAIVAVPRVPQREYLLTVAFVAVPAFLFAQLQGIPARPVSRSLNVVALVAAAFLAFQLVTINFRSGLGDDAVSIAAPFASGEWTVSSGGRSTLINHHYAPITPQQRHAVDLVMVRHGRTHDGDAGDPTSYHAWDQPIVAPADGNVVDVENGLRDHPIGSREYDPERARGNYVVLDIGGGRYVTLAHLQQGTVTVTEGDRVAAGDVIARLGNSGNTTEPHLHLQIQDVVDLPSDPFATGVETFPIQLTDVVHVRGGTEHTQQQGQLRSSDLIRVDDRIDDPTSTESESEQP